MNLGVKNSKCPPTPLSGLRDQWARGNRENSFPASDTSRALAMARPQVSRRLQEHQELYGGEKKRMNTMLWWSLPWGWAVHLSRSLITSAHDGAERPSLPCNGQLCWN